MIRRAASRHRLCCALCGASLVLAALAACDREEQAHEVHLNKGSYAGKLAPKLGAQQVSALERRAANENY